VTLSILVAALAAAAAPADGLDCIYDGLTPAERALAARSISGTPEAESAAKESEVSIARELDRCLARWHWVRGQGAAAAIHALLRSSYDAARAALPPGRAGSLDAFLATLAPEESYGLTPEGANAMGDAAFRAYAVPMKRRILATGIAEADFMAAINYLSAAVRLARHDAGWPVVQRPAP
jgi:hypothetical protein